MKEGRQILFGKEVHIQITNGKKDGVKWYQVIIRNRKGKEIYKFDPCGCGAERGYEFLGIGKQQKPVICFRSAGNFLTAVKRLNKAERKNGTTLPRLKTAIGERVDPCVVKVYVGFYKKYFENSAKQSFCHHNL